MKQKRLTLALLVAPLAAPLIYFCWVVLRGRGEEFRLLDLLFGFQVVLIFALPVSYISTIVLGLPSYMLLRRYNMLNMFTLTSVGLFFGFAVFYFFLQVLSGFQAAAYAYSIEYYMWLGVGAMMGGSVAMAFGLIGGITNHSSTPLRGRTR